MDTIICGHGPLGRAIESAFVARGEATHVVGRPTAGRHEPSVFDGGRLVIDASVGEAVLPNVGAALAAGCRSFVIATTGWETDRHAVGSLLLDAEAAAVVAPNLSLGAALFLRLVEHATVLYEATDSFEPYVLEWHRRGKRDRPSGTARELAGRIDAHRRRASDVELEVVSIRAGSSPGAHLVGFDAPGETVELRLTARDRTAYAAGALAAAEWLQRSPRASGFHPFDRVVDELLDSRPVAVSA